MGARTNIILVALTGVYAVYATALALAYGFPITWNPSYQLQLYAALTAATVGPLFVWDLFRTRPESPLRHSVTFAARFKLKDRFVAALAPLLLVGFLMAGFGSIKSGIPAITTFWMDPALADLDEAIHGGPVWLLLQPLLGHPWVTTFLNAGYHLWAVVLYGSVFWFAVWIERPRLREQFFVAYLLTWFVLGSVGAVLMPSVGPCFYELFHHSDRFAPLMAYLHHADGVSGVPALGVQQTLVDWYQSGQYGLGRGISAMPSMHIASTMLITIAAWRSSRAWGIAATIFLALIFLSSVHLGYHYAVDGYFSLLVTPLLWWIAGRLPGRARLPEVEPASL